MKTMRTALVRGQEGNLHIKHYDDYESQKAFAEDLRGNGYKVLKIWNGNIDDTAVDDWELMNRQDCFNSESRKVAITAANEVAELDMDSDINQTVDNNEQTGNAEIGKDCCHAVETPAATQESESSPFKVGCKTVNSEGNDENPSSDAIFNNELRELFSELETTAFESLQLRELHGEDSDAVFAVDRKRDAIAEKILTIALGLMNQRNTFKEQYCISKSVDKEIERRVTRGFDRFNAWKADSQVNSEEKEPMFYMEDTGTVNKPSFTATVEDSICKTFDNAGEAIDYLKKVSDKFSETNCQIQDAGEDVIYEDDSVTVRYYDTEGREVDYDTFLKVYLALKTVDGQPSMMTA